jgi:hypothetical protein
MDATALEGPWNLPIGAPALTAEGNKLGIVTAADAYDLHVEDGLLFRNTHILPLSAVAGYEDGLLVLNLTTEQVAVLPQT